jgi:hypothetical protein
VEREVWRDQAQADFARLETEDLSGEPDDWSLDSTGKVVLHLGGLT